MIEQLPCCYLVLLRALDIFILKEFSADQKMLHDWNFSCDIVLERVICQPIRQSAPKCQYHLNVRSAADVF